MEISLSSSNFLVLVTLTPSALLAKLTLASVFSAATAASLAFSAPMASLASALLATLVKNTPHAPGRLFVGVAPRKHVGEGSDVHSDSETKYLTWILMNLVATRNKKMAGMSHYFLAGTGALKKFRIQKTGTFKKGLTIEHSDEFV
jgi:hypothetical protein